jgi:hypothetical protein
MAKIETTTDDEHIEAISEGDGLAAIDECEFPFVLVDAIQIKVRRGRVWTDETSKTSRR